MRDFIQYAVIAVSALSISCEGYTPARVRGLQTNSTTAPPAGSMGMHDMSMASTAPPMAKGATPMPKGKSDKDSGKNDKSSKSMMGKSESASMKAMDSKSDKGMSSKGMTMGMSTKGKGKGKGTGKGKGSTKSTDKSKGSGMSKGKGMKMMMMGKGKGKGKGGGTSPPSAPTPPVAPTPAPVLPPGETHSPTASPTGPLPFPELSVTFSLFYTIEQFRLPLPSEFATVTALTEDHVTPFYESGFDDDDLVTYFNSATVLESTDFNFGEPVGITYVSTLIFTQDSFLPREEEVEGLITRAFSGSNLQVYVNQITSLPPSNIFSTTTEVSLTTGEVSSTRGGGLGGLTSSSSTTRIFVGAAAGASVAALAIAGLVLSGRRRKKQQERQKTLASDGHCTVGDITYDSRSIGERAGDANGLEDVTLDD